MKAAAVAGRLLALLGLVGLAGCSDQSVVAQLRSLSGSEDVVFVCRDGNGVGHPYTDCPDRDLLDDADPAKHLSVVALVSQTVTDEVAVIDVSAGTVVDVDPSTPGFGFLRVGGRPVSMATTPGGKATFVATADVGRNGIFALPTSCIEAPKAGEQQRDLTTWPACRLQETPGEMAVLVEPTTTDPASLPAGVPTTCATPYVTAANDAGGEGGATAQGESASTAPGCSANLSTELGAQGRRKLVVALPDSGRLAVLDAEQLLDAATPGTFPDCVIERYVPLTVDVPAGVTQTLPADLTSTCNEVLAPTAPQPAKRSPRPAGFAVSDGRLYVADLAAPVIHVLDTTSTCGMTELPSLLPMSQREPERIVTTRRVAVSPLTPAGQRFAYAIDAEDQPGASVMVFDVSPGSTEKTPLVRSGSPELLGEKPDRLALGSSAKDVTFAYRDIPYVDPVTGTAQFGNRCDPDPAAPANTPGVLARPSADYLSGARPLLLRGLFGFILLTNGSIAVVDVDDFDSDCRRPVSGNTSSTPNFQGCANDKIDGSNAFQTSSATSALPTVTAEVSCRVVEQHRFRSSRFALNNSTIGVDAPSLRSFPQLTLPPAAASSVIENRPRLLGVPFAAGDGSAVDVDVYVGSTLYNTNTNTETKSEAVLTLPTDPNNRDSELLQSVNSVVLPPLEPRSYSAEDTVTVTYEGSYAGDRTSGFFDEVEGDANSATLRDASLSFCGAGVYDRATMADYAERELGLSRDQAQAFGVAHADYVQLTTDFPAEDDIYWRGPDVTKAGLSLAECTSRFGPFDAQTLSTARDFSIVSATGGQLLLTPRSGDGGGKISVRAAKLCFPTSQNYRLRAGAHWVLLHSSSGFRHDVIESGPDRLCTRSCNPLKKWDKGRVFEISSDPQQCKTVDEAGAVQGDILAQRVGCAATDEVACVYDQGAPDMSTGAVPLDSSAAKCIFNGINDRFALYRGRVPSVRDSVFTWQTTGGFTPLVMSLASVSTVVSPQSIVYLSQPEQMAVVDGSSQGLSLFSLDTFAITAPSPFY